MTSDELRQDKELGPGLSTASDRELSISKHVMFRVDSDGVLVAVGGEHKNEEYALYALIDALHLRLCRNGGRGRVRVALGRSDDEARTARLLQAVAIQASVIRDHVEVTLLQDREPVGLDLAPPDAPAAWPTRLEWREKLLHGQLPHLASELSTRVGSPLNEFAWYATLYSTALSGRVEGLEVCKVHLAKPCGRLGIGGGGQSTAQQRFEKLTGEPGPIPIHPENVARIAELIKRLVEDRSRADGSHLGSIQREHLLESKLLRRLVSLDVPAGSTLIPEVGQFPALWADDGSARYLDVLARDRDVPCAVELKVPSGGGHGKYYRHAVGQVVLYREFIRHAKSLREWFAGRGLDATRCRGAVAFPRATGGAARRLDEVRDIANLFDVDVIELDDGNDRPNG